MSKISTYDNASPVSLSDRLIGTSVGATPANSTKNFLVSDILSLFESNLSNAYVLMTLGSATNAQATTITTINTPVQVDLNSLAVATEAQGFSVANDGTITCTHTQNIVGKISVSISHLSLSGS